MRTRPVSRIKSLGDALDELIDSLGIQKKLSEQRVLEYWDGAVGERIAQVARPTRITKGVLFISVNSAAWRNELSLRKTEIVGKLNQALNEELVTDIKFQ